MRASCRFQAAVIDWDWVIVLFFVLPIGYFGWYVLTIEGALGPGMLALLLPAATLFYGLRGLQGAFRLIDVCAT